MMHEAKKLCELKGYLLRSGEIPDVHALLMFLLKCKPSTQKLAFGEYVITYFVKHVPDVNLTELTSLILHDINMFFTLMGFKYASIDGLIVEQLQTVCLFGVLEYLQLKDSTCNSLCISSIGYFIIDRLKCYSPNVLLQSFALANAWYSFVFLKIPDMDFDECLIKCSKMIFRCVWLHAASSNGTVRKAVHEFYQHIFHIFLTSNKKDFRFLSLREVFVNGIIPHHFANITDHFKLPKNSVHCLLSVAKWLKLNEVFIYDSFLLWSLILAIGYNCTSNSACDIIKFIFKQSLVIKETSAQVYDCNLMRPVVQFMLTGNLACPMSVMPYCCNLFPTTAEPLQNASWDNFVNNCLNGEFILLSSPETLEIAFGILSDHEAAELRKHDLLIDQLLEHLPTTFLSPRRDDQSLNTTERKLLVWLRLLSLKDYPDLPLSVKQLVPTILTQTASHHNESIRILALKGISKFLCKYIHANSKGNDEKRMDLMLCDSSSTQIFMDLFLNCCSTFYNCFNPSFRNEFQKILSNLMECIRTTCKSIQMDSMEVSFVLNRDINLSNSNKERTICLPDAEICLDVFNHLFDFSKMEGGNFISIQENGVIYLVKLIRFISSVCHTTTIHHARTFCQNATNWEVISTIHTYFWPGMSYQRAKLLLNIIETALGVFNLTPTGPWNKKCSKWKSDFSKDSLYNLLTLINNISVHCHWDYKSTNLLQCLFNGLLYVSSDLQSQILSIVYDHWIDRKDEIKRLIYPNMINLACEWCDTPWCSVYTCGANILTFCCTNELWDSAYFGADIRMWFLNKLRRFSELTLMINVSLRYVNLSMFSSKLLQVAQFQCGLGFLMTVDQILTKCLTKLTKISKNLEPTTVIDLLLYEFICCNELPSLCLELCNLCLFSMGCQMCQFNQEDNIFVVDFSKGASSFQELGKAILKTITLARQVQSLSPSETIDSLLSQCHLMETLYERTTSLAVDGDNSDVNLLASIELLPEYQHILSWAWNTLKYCSSIIANWFAIQCKLPKENMTAERKLIASKIGYQLLHQLLQCRHKGTIEALYFNLSLYLQTVENYKSSLTFDDTFESQISEMDSTDLTTDINFLTKCNDAVSADQMLEICWLVLCNSAYSITRRAAGLRPVIRACLLIKSCNGLENPPCSLVRCLKRLFAITQSDDNDYIRTNKTICTISDSNTLHDSPRVFALHLLHALFTDARLRVHEHPVPIETNQTNQILPVRNWTIEALRLAVVPGFSSKKWNVWNAALQLHSALIYHLTGTSLDLEFPLISDVCFQYPQMLDMILNCLIDNYQNSSATQTLIPILTLIVRFSPSYDHSLMVSSKVDEILKKLEYILFNHCSMHIRKLASKAYFTFLCPPIDAYYQDQPPICSQDRQSSLCKVLCNRPLKIIHYSCCIHKSMNKPLYNSISNAAHAHLCLLQSWYESKTCKIIHHWRESLFNTESALNYLFHWISISAWYLAYELCILMNSVYANHSSTHIEEIYRTKLWTVLLTLPKSIFTLSYEPFHLEFLTEFRHVCSRLFNEPLFDHIIIHHKETEPNLLLRFLNLITLDSNFSEEFTLKLINYWINWQSSTYHDQYAYNLLEYVHPDVMWCILKFFNCPYHINSFMEIIQQKFNIEHLLSRICNLCSVNIKIPGLQFCMHRSRLLYFMTHLLTRLPSNYSLYMDQWLGLLSSCLQYHNSKTSRILASKSLQLFTLEFNRNNSTKSSSNQIYLMQRFLTIPQRKRLLDCIFHSLFDESSEVRLIMSQIINLWLKSFSNNLADSMLCINDANTHLVSLHKFLQQIVPLLLNEDCTNINSSGGNDNTKNNNSAEMQSKSDLMFTESTHWLCDNWLTIMKSINCLVIDEYESSRRHILYDRESYNTFCEPRLQIDLLFTYLRLQQDMFKENLPLLASSLVHQADEHLQSECTLRGLQVENVLNIESWCGPVVPFGVFTRDYSFQLINSLKLKT
ncbi:hypothetical protein MN116_002203 [Schistosoma mekongi]|uniref:DUF2428 domain-containing protein n=1 Tax=Schistosoma mekongi TaxID=38744 RepID=A0AAE1ZJA3_SCHME|nr:hypothetical protein MN116_002203 [Schistosoma mekongi]